VQTIPHGLMYLSAAHGEAEIETTMRAITGALQQYGDTHDDSDTP
jgi:hypothetical protein